MAPDLLTTVTRALQQAEQAVAEARKLSEERDRETAALRAEVAALKQALELQKRRGERDKASAVRAVQEEHRRRIAGLKDRIGRAETAVQDVKAHLSSVSVEEKPEEKPIVAKVPAKAAMVSPRVLKRKKPISGSSSEDSDSSDSDLEAFMRKERRCALGAAPLGVGNTLAGSSTKPPPGHAGDVSAPAHIASSVVKFPLTCHVSDSEDNPYGLVASLS